MNQLIIAVFFAVFSLNTFAQDQYEYFATCGDSETMKPALTIFMSKNETKVLLMFTKDFKNLEFNHMIFFDVSIIEADDDKIIFEHVYHTATSKFTLTREYKDIEVVTTFADKLKQRVMSLKCQKHLVYFK